VSFLLIKRTPHFYVVKWGVFPGLGWSCKWLSSLCEVSPKGSPSVAKLHLKAHFAWRTSLGGAARFLKEAPAPKRKTGFAGETTLTFALSKSLHLLPQLVFLQRAKTQHVNFVHIPNDPFPQGKVAPQLGEFCALATFHFATRFLKGSLCQASPDCDSWGPILQPSLRGRDPQARAAKHPLFLP
jgi:hypothetical protein